MVKIMVNVQKRSTGASDEVDFWHGENLDNGEEKKLKMSSMSDYLYAYKMRGKSI